MERAKARGCEFLLVSPLRADLPAGAGAEWVAGRSSGSDTALMLALVHTLVVNGLHDRAFLDRCAAGWPVFERYLLGESDGQPKDRGLGLASRRHWRVRRIVALAKRLHGKRALIVVAHALRRAEHGEQPVWMGMVLAAALGQIGLPGGGYGYGLGAIAYTADATMRCRCRPSRRARSRERLHPGGAHFRHAAQSGRELSLQRPDADLSRDQAGLLGRRRRLPPPSGPRRAAAGPSPASTRWSSAARRTATARHADVVLPAR
ncbi:molybdopterin-dependent oxidoreductase [Bosea thiooxidans]